MLNDYRLLSSAVSSCIKQGTKVRHVRGGAMTALQEATLTEATELLENAKCNPDWQLTKRQNLLVGKSTYKIQYTHHAPGCTLVLHIALAEFVSFYTCAQQH